MKKTLISLGVALTFTVAVFATALGVAWRQEDSLLLTQEVIYGDPEAAQGLSLTLYTGMTNYLKWDTQVELGEVLDWDTRFSCTWPEDIYEQDAFTSVSLSTFYSVTMSGYVEDLIHREYPSLAPMIEDVIQETKAGETEHRAILSLSDYMENLPLSFDGYTQDNATQWAEVTQFFHIPVENQKCEITVSKDQEGNVYEVAIVLDQPPNLYGNGFLEGDSWYITFAALDPSGVPIAGAAQPGIYRLPILPEEGSNGYQVDTQGVELIYASQEGRHLNQLFPMEGGKRLMATTDLQGQDPAILVLDASTMTLLQELPLEEASWYSIYPQEDCVTILPIGEDGFLLPASVWALGEKGDYERVIHCDLSQGEMDGLYGLEARYEKGRLLIAGQLDYSTISAGVGVAVCDRQGLVYAARLHHSQGQDSYSFPPYFRKDPTLGSSLPQ